MAGRLIALHIGPPQHSEGIGRYSTVLFSTSFLPSGIPFSNFDGGVYQMARQQKRASSGLTPGQALYVIDRMMREGKVSARDIDRMASEMDGEIADLERRLAMLRTDSASGGARRSRSGAPPVRRRRQSANVSPAVAASRRLQGEYMGLMRHMSSRDRARIKKMAAEEGREAAVKEMRVLLGR